MVSCQRHGTVANPDAAGRFTARSDTLRSGRNRRSLTRGSLLPAAANRARIGSSPRRNRQDGHFLAVVVELAATQVQRLAGGVAQAIQAGERFRVALLHRQLEV